MSFGTCVTLFTLFVTAVRGNIDKDKVLCLPRQAHLAYGDTVRHMVVMWSTRHNCSTDVRYGSGPWNLDKTASGKSIYFAENNMGLQYIHRVLLENLEAGVTYYYTPVSNSISSGPFYFKMPPSGEDWSPEFMLYGDLGLHSESIPKLTAEALRGEYTAVLHVGDFAYNLHDNLNMENASDCSKATQVGDAFMQMIQDMTSHVAYMTSPGNHEIDNDTFAHYRHRFSMPQSEWPIPLHQMWYSIDIGNVHFLSYSSETFFTSNGTYVNSQYEWIKQDLHVANQNRDKCPWVIAFGHRPMYCSNNDGDDCTKIDSKVRKGFEELFYEYGVDVVIQAHEHSYERLWPMFKGVVLAKNYSNPTAPVQLITGAAGSKHGIDDFNNSNIADWSAFHIGNKSFNSYGKIVVTNRTHLYWEQISVADGQVLDSIWISQTNHGPFDKAKLTVDIMEKIDESIKKEQIITQANSKPKTTDTSVAKGDEGSFFNNVSTRIALGAGFGGLFFVFFATVCIVHRCKKKRSKNYRRWETLDYGRKFYSNVKNGEKDTDDFESEVSDGTSKLLERD
ncbi:hypothetical protein ACJMK2_010596 [Sinanodonta woodiana]|uniref:Purple acid phosphatase n=1 Tax=Sinanodonta woodiana TaxID=1069815 RepID=A0ABD3VIW6_SINWO